MNHERIRLGVIQKIVRVPLMQSPDGDESSAPEFQGYGILREADGRDLFFVGSAVIEGDFDSLEAGTNVTYVKEPGPLARAAQLRICDIATIQGPIKQEQCRCQTPPGIR